MEGGRHSGGVMAKADVPGAGGEAKQETEMGEANGGGGGAAAPAAVEGTVTVRIYKANLDCPLCTFPLKPPIFQCDVGHLACSACDGLLSGNQCYACDRSGSYGRNPTLEDYLRSVRVPCPYDVYGCRAHVAYCEADDHQRECPCAPCCCPEPGCPFSGSPRMLLAHIAGEHAAACPVPVAYGRERRLRARLARRWHALVGEEDGSLFLVSLRALGAVTAVSLVCVRANAAAPQYTCRLALELPGGGGEDARVVAMESKVGSSALSGAAPDYGLFVAAHQLSLCGEMLELSIRIDKLGDPTPACSRRRRRRRHHRGHNRAQTSLELQHAEVRIGSAS